MGYLGRTKPSETTSSVLRSTYTGNGSTTTYALPGPVANETSIIATINGVTQQDAAYSTDGSNIIFDAAPASGDSIEIRTISAVAMSYAPMAGSVVTGIIADGAVTTGKLATGAAVANIGNRAITVGQMPAGSVLQVVSTITSTTTTLTNMSTWTDITNLSVSITPSSASSKILVLASASYEIFRSAIEVAGALKIVRNSTDVFAQYNNSLGLEAGLSTGSRIYFDGQWNGMVLDSPSTTSSVTYKIQGYNTQNANSGRLIVNAQTNNQSSITVMEIAA